MDWTDGTVVSRAEGAAFRQLEGKAFIVGAASSKLVMLNETGTAIWSYLDYPSSVDDLAQRLVGEFEVAPADARADCEAFLSALLERELVSLER